MHIYILHETYAKVNLKQRGEVRTLRFGNNPVLTGATGDASQFLVKMGAVSNPEREQVPHPAG